MHLFVVGKNRQNHDFNEKSGMVSETNSSFAGGLGDKLPPSSYLLEILDRPLAYDASRNHIHVEFDFCRHHQRQHHRRRRRRCRRRCCR